MVLLKIFIAPLVLAAAILIITSNAYAEKGCPSGFFSHVPGGKCTAVAEFNRLSLDDSKPMAFGSRGGNCLGEMCKVKLKKLIIIISGQPCM